MGTDFEAIIAGGGVVGGYTALTLAKAGHRVLLVDTPSSSRPGCATGVAWKGRPPGAPALPISRWVVERRFALLSPGTSFSIDYRDAAWPEAPMAPFVVESPPWGTALREAAMKAGATVWSGSEITGLKSDANGKVAGVEAGPKGATASVTVVCDSGAVALGAKAGLRWAVGGPGEARESVVESVYPMSTRTVDDRCGPGPGRAICWEGVLGFLPGGAMAFGYLVPGQESMTAGVVVHAPSAERAGLSARDVAEKFVAHPSIAPFLRGAKASSTNSRSVPSSPPRRRPLFGEGYLLAGEATGFLPAGGFVVPGMDLVLRSGQMAADTVREALELKDPSGRVTSRYAARLQRAGLISEIERARGGGARFKWNPRVHSLYPQFFATFFRRMMTEEGQPKEHMRDLLRSAVRDARVPYTGVAHDAIGGIAHL